jgi:Xaa-Pro aminopeptidase
MTNDWASGPFAVDYEHRVDIAALRTKRVAKAAAALRAADLQALLVWKDENVRYLTSLRPQLIAGKSGLLNGALLLADGHIVLFVSGGDADRARARMPWIDDIHPIPILEETGLVSHFVAETLAAVVARHGLNRGRIGIDIASQALHGSLRSEFPEIEWVDGDLVMQRVRLVKFREEIGLLQEAVAIADAVTEAAIAAIRPGVRETDVAADALHTLYRLGGEYAHVTTPFVASGERMSPPTRLATDKIIRSGDLVFVDIGAMFNGYFGDVGRTVICGDPSEMQRAIFRAVYDAHMAGLDAIRPGATTMSVAAHIRTAAERHGMGRHLLSLFIGHGIGLGSNEPPYIGEIFPGAADVVLEPGMAFAVEPLIWVPGVRGGGGVRLEDTVVVDERGVEVLSRVPYDARLREAGAS